MKRFLVGLLSARVAAPTQRRRSLRVFAGAVLIAASFLSYLLYPVILLVLPFRATIKLGMLGMLWFASWLVFVAGVIVAGPESWHRLRMRRLIHLFRRRSAHSDNSLSHV
jgi:hypothetical protein